uniref:Uncharacterized protein n=1 Tax=Pyxicephalus adspersus TaxID=30357 RepID=A0AAV3AD50_PYXAD|nr:TPA: hypothetical protein GDO54_015608 [Pyxicephalus adspersus]
MKATILHQTWNFIKVLWAVLEVKQLQAQSYHTRIRVIIYFKSNEIKELVTQLKYTSLFLCYYCELSLGYIISETELRFPYHIWTVQFISFCFI